MPGPLPDPNARRRNQPTIPTTSLPAEGIGFIPDVPEWENLGPVGRLWWEWAWSQPQSAGWGVNAGMESVVARRASLEDDLAALAAVAGLDFSELGDAESVQELTDIVRRVARLATGRLQIVKEMRDLDDRLGLTPKGLAALRWKVVGEVEAKAKPDDEVARRREERRKAALG